jgi:RimJ/RimL family protein N-acetyltransferase
MWHFTDDIAGFLARAGDFLRSRPALHTTPLTVLSKLPTRESTVFGWLEEGGSVRALLYRRPSGRLTLTVLSASQASSLAAELDLTLSGVTADHDTAAAFASAWRLRTGVVPVRSWQGRLHRLGTLTPPSPVPAGRAASARDHAQVVRWCDSFVAAVGETPVPWADSRFADKHFTFWETPDSGPVAMAGATPMLAGMVRVDPVHTPAHLRGRGYAGAVTTSVTRAALDAGATDVVLFTNPHNPTSNALYQRIGYVPIAEFTGYDFPPGVG